MLRFLIYMQFENRLAQFETSPRDCRHPRSSEDIASHIKRFDDRIDDVWSYSGGSEPGTELAG
jgi:hypothetical protein